MRGPLRVYADTSVYGGCFDDEFATPSRAFFDEVREGRFVLVVSPVVRTELEGAPEPVRGFYREILPVSEPVDLTDDSFDLQQAHLAAGIVGAGATGDALHVATAVTSGCAIIVSWNFRHIVNFDRIRRYNAVGALHGWPPIAIHSPAEVLRYGEEEL